MNPDRTALRVTTSALAALLAAGCVSGSSPAKDKALCDAVATDLAGSGLTGTPTREQAAAAGLRLDARVTQVASPSLHAAVVELHSHLHAIDTAQRDHDAARADTAAGKARADARTIAKRCSKPDSDYLGAP